MPKEASWWARFNSAYNFWGQYPPWWWTLTLMKLVDCFLELSSFWNGEVQVHLARMPESMTLCWCWQNLLSSIIHKFTLGSVQSYWLNILYMCVSILHSIVCFLLWLFLCLLIFWSNWFSDIHFTWFFKKKNTSNADFWQGGWVEWVWVQQGAWWAPSPPYELEGRAWSTLNF